MFYYPETVVFDLSLHSPRMKSVAPIVSVSLVQSIVAFSWYDSTSRPLSLPPSLVPDQHCSQGFTLWIYVLAARIVVKLFVHLMSTEPTFIDKLNSKTHRKLKLATESTHKFHLPVFRLLLDTIDHSVFHIHLSWIELKWWWFLRNDEEDPARPCRVTSLSFRCPMIGERMGWFRTRKSGVSRLPCWEWWEWHCTFRTPILGT